MSMKLYSKISITLLLTLVVGCSISFGTLAALTCMRFVKENRESNLHTVTCTIILVDFVVSYDW